MFLFLMGLLLLLSLLELVLPLLLLEAGAGVVVFPSLDIVGYANVVW